MELSEEQKESIKNIVKGLEKRNRNVALSRFFSDKNICEDDTVLKTFELYKKYVRSAKYSNQQNMEIDIAIELDISKEQVCSIIKYIDFVSKRVDYELAVNYYNYDYKEYRKKVIEEQDKVRKKNESRATYIKKKDVMRRQLDMLFSNYDEATAKRKLSTEKLKLIIKDVENKIAVLGNSVEDTLILASMYADIGKLGECNAILSKVKYDELSVTEKNRYKNAKVREIRMNNIKYISDLYKKGLSYEEIKKECEKQATSYRAGIISNGQPKIETIGLTSEFIKKVYNGLKKQQIKGKKNKDEKER